MPVVLANNPGQRVLLYGSDGAALVVVKVDTSGRLLIAIPQERNPLTIALSYTTGGVAPHVATERFTYTVPASRAAILSSAFFSIMRITAASAVGQVSARLILTNLASSTTWLLESSILTNAVGDKAQNMITLALYLRAGEILTATSDDGSTGGTIRMLLGAALTEFDA